ncbi:MAG TPA: hypothetical protein VLG38_08030, partial [Gammaproteobacteria bacterium]|nr:hypothetical protein [Gammaproteobacteria bacterium]
EYSRNEYRACVTKYYHLCTQQADVSDEKLKEQQTLLAQAAIKHFTACGMPEEVAQTDFVAKGIMTVESLEKFKKVYLTCVNDTLSEIRKLEHKRASADATYADLNNQDTKADIHVDRDTIDDDIKKKRAKIDPLLEGATQLAGESVTYRDIIRWGIKLIARLAGLVDAGMWYLGSFVTGAMGKADKREMQTLAAAGAAIVSGGVIGTPELIATGVDLGIGGFAAGNKAIPKSTLKKEEWQNSAQRRIDEDSTHTLEKAIDQLAQLVTEPVDEARKHKKNNPFNTRFTRS